MTRPRHIAVFGSSQCRREDALWQEACTLGRGLAALGCAVVTGGYGGVMEAASLGAREQGGHTVGLTAGELGGREPNAYIAERVHARDLPERLRNFAQRADAFIALHGGVGTLLEVALLWNLKVLRAVDGPPIWLVGDAWSAMHEAWSASLAIRAEDHAHIACVADVPVTLAAVAAHFHLTS